MENNSLCRELKEVKTNLDNLREMAKHCAKLSLEKWADPDKEKEFLQSTAEVANAIGKAEYTLILTKEKFVKETKTEGLVHDLISKISYSFIAVRNELLDLNRFCGKSRVGRILKRFNRIIEKLGENDSYYRSEKLFWDMWSLKEGICEFYNPANSKALRFVELINVLIDMHIVEKEPKSRREIDIMKIYSAINFLDCSVEDLSLIVAMFELIGWETNAAKRFVVELI